jgi:hypothetical protein
VTLSDKRISRKFSAQQKSELVLASLRGQVRRLERALGRKTLEVEIAGELVRGWE